MLNYLGQIQKIIFYFFYESIHDTNENVISELVWLDMLFPHCYGICGISFNWATANGMNLNIAASLIFSQVNILLSRKENLQYHKVCVHEYVTE